jgi:hypothetical protein
VPAPSDVTAEEILRGMIRARMGSTDPGDIAQAEHFRKYMAALSALQALIGTLGRLVRQAETLDGAATWRGLETQFKELQAGMEAMIVTPWREGYEQGFEGESAEQDREQVLAKVIDLTSRLSLDG